MGLCTNFLLFFFNDNKNSDSDCDAEKHFNVTVIRLRIANIPKMLGYFCEMHGMIQCVFHNTSFNSHFIYDCACFLADFPCYPLNNTVLRFISCST